MQSAPTWKLRTISSTSSDHSTSQHPIYATERARLLLGSYRRGDANDPDTYVAACAAVLACYSTEIIKRVTDPRTGISTAEKFQAFPPNSGELKAYCDEQQARDARIAAYRSLPPANFARLPAPPPGPGTRATVFVPTSAPQYKKMVESSQKPDADPFDWRMDIDRAGIWVSRSWIT
jgi:hypothetical protein